MSQWWNLYLNRRVAASVSESLDALGCQAPFSLEPILAELEGGRYVGPIPPIALRDLVSRSRGRGGGGGDGGDGGATSEKRKASTMRGDARVRMRYDAHLPTLSLRDRENSRSILVGTVLPTLQGAVLCNNCHLCGYCW